MSMGTVTPLRQRMIEDMNARKLCAGTQRGHIHSCKRFAVFEPATRSYSKLAFPPQVPGHTTAAQNTRHLAPELTVNDRTPGHEEKLMAVVDQREATRRQIDPAAIDARHGVALLDWPVC